MKIGKAVVKCRFVILALSLLLLVPSVIGFMNTRVNYDMLVYLPEEIETMKGQKILEEDFGTGAICMLLAENMENKDVSALKEQIEQVPHVNGVLWYDSVMDISVPMKLLPKKLYETFVKGDATLMAITFDTTTSADETMDAVEAIRALLGENCYLQGTSAVVTDTKNLTQHEEPIYVALAVALALVVSMLAMDSWIIPVFFLLSIGAAILYNMGSNIFIGEISYVTKAVAAVLQLGVTMDYSIFLWHSYCENKTKYDSNKDAMAAAIDATLQSVIGSSITTIAGFAALCFMSFTFGRDVGVVMMKGVLFGVIVCVTLLPSMILIFDRFIVKTLHKPLLPHFPKLPAFVAKHYRLILILFALIWIPAIYGYTRTDVYYNLDKSLPRNLPSLVASDELDEKFNMNNTMMILMDANLETKDVQSMIEEIKATKGVDQVIGIDAFAGAGIPREMLPSELTGKLTTDQYSLMLLTSEYKPATDEINAQIDTLNAIIDKYDTSAMLIGDAACIKDLITISNHDFNVVNWVSIGMIFLIILFVFGSVSLPVLLVLVIEFAIFINMAIPFYTGTSLPFVASIIIGTVQLGSTVDYAILMTSRYKTERAAGKDKEEAVRIAHGTSIPSIMVSGLTFFAATFGVGLYSNIDIVSSICTLMARGALISTVTVILVLPAVFMLCDGLIIRTSRGFRPVGESAGERSGKHGLHLRKKTA